MSDADIDINDILKKLPECPICQDCYSEQGSLKPKLLRCGHSLCEGCGDKLCRNGSDQQPPSCPLCRQPFGIPAKGFASFPSNLAVLDMVRLMTKLRDAKKPKVPCGKHRDASVDVYCTKCGVSVCARCYVAEHVGHPSWRASDLRAHLCADVDGVEKVCRGLQAADEASRRVDAELTRLVEDIAKEGRRKAMLVEAQTAFLIAECRRVGRQGAGGDGKELRERMTSAKGFVERCRQVLRERSDELVLYHGVRLHTGVGAFLLPVPAPSSYRVDVQFRTLPMTTWFPVDGINLVGELVAKNSGQSDVRSYRELEVHLEETREKATELQMELERVDEDRKNAGQEAEVEKAKLVAEGEERQSNFQKTITQLRQMCVRYQKRAEDLEADVKSALSRNEGLERQLETERERVLELENNESEQKRKIQALKQAETQMRKQLESREFRLKQLQQLLDDEMARRMDAESQSRHDNQYVDNLSFELYATKQRVEEIIGLYRERLINYARTLEQRADADERREEHRAGECQLKDAENRVGELLSQLEKMQRRTA